MRVYCRKGVWTADLTTTADVVAACSDGAHWAAKNPALQPIPPVDYNQIRASAYLNGAAEVQKQTRELVAEYVKQHNNGK